MSAHDPLCTALDPARLLPRFCDCERVAKIREAIARDIEAKRQERMASDWASLDESMEGHEAGMEFALRIAARIARGGAL